MEQKGVWEIPWVFPKVFPEYYWGNNISLVYSHCGLSENPEEDGSYFKTQDLETLAHKAHLKIQEHRKSIIKYLNISTVQIPYFRIHTLKGKEA